MTKLERFRRANRVRPMALVRASGVSQRALIGIRKGHNTTLESAKAIAAGMTELLGREVTVEELFDLSIPKKKRAAA